MANPILSKLNQNQMMSNLAPLKKTISLLRAAKNPKAFVQDMIATDPNMKKALDYVNSNGGDPKAAFYKLTKENGIDPNEIISSIF